MIYDLVKKSRSCRGYDSSREVTRPELMQLVECARLCPSTMNLQALKYYIAYEKQDTDAVLSLTKWGGALPELSLPRPGTGPAAFIVICQDLGINASDKGFSVDIGAAAQTMLLAAAEMGLGGCMLGSFDSGRLCAALKLPENILPRLVVAIGKPAETIVIKQIDGGSTAYYRDENDVHYVPKRKLSDIIIN